MRYKGVILDEPYKCNPYDRINKCNILFNIDTSDKNFTALGNRGFVEVPCKCSFGRTGSDPDGFCASVIGSDDYQKAVTALSNVL